LSVVFSVFSLHQKFALALIALGLAGAIWCFVDFRRQGGLSGGVRAFLILCWALVVVQDLLGLLLLAEGRRPSNLILHLMYGALATVVLPLALWSAARRHLSPPQPAGSKICFSITGSAPPCPPFALQTSTS
jgi:heme A synthase